MKMDIYAFFKNLKIWSLIWVQTGYHELNPPPPPLDDCLLGVYYKIFLEFFEQKNVRNLEFFLQIHYTIMLWFTLKKLLKICHCKK
jgi:hypothetical protein